MRRAICLLLLLLLILPAGLTEAAPAIDVNITNPDTPSDVMGMLNVFLGLTVLSLAPAILVLMTSFTRITIVLSFVRSALATQQVPPNQVLIGLALFLTVFIMGPVLATINQDAIQPYLAGELSQQQALAKAEAPLREFMVANTRVKDLELFVELSQDPAQSVDEVPFLTIVPAFVISELKTAFQMGFMIFVPFLVLDMIVASTLMSMGMMMLPPVMISLPFKILLFVLVDGWSLVIRSLVQSF